MMESTQSTSTLASHGKSKTYGPRFFKDITPVDTRKRLAEKVKERYAGHLPIICEPSDLTDETIHIEKKKFLCPATLRISEFIVVLRGRLKKLLPSEALYLFIGENNSIPNNSMSVADAYLKYASKEDGLLYIKFAKENTFG